MSRDADVIRVLLGACESAARGLEAAAALVADRVNLAGVIEEHAARHLQLCERLEHLGHQVDDDPARPHPAASPPGGLTSADAVVLRACRDLAERTEAAYRLALEVTDGADVRAELDAQYDEVRRLRADIDAMREPVLRSLI